MAQEMILELKMQREVMLMNLEEQLGILTQEMYQKEIKACNNEELYFAILKLAKGLINITTPISGDKKVYYISAEFLIGKLLSNNLINLGVYDKLDEILNKSYDNFDQYAAISEITDIEVAKVIIKRLLDKLK